MWFFPQSNHNLCIVLPKKSTFLDINVRKLGLRFFSCDQDDQERKDAQDNQEGTDAKEDQTGKDDQEDQE